MRSDICDERVGGDSDSGWWEEPESVMDDRLPASSTYWRTLSQLRHDIVQQPRSCRAFR